MRSGLIFALSLGVAAPTWAAQTCPKDLKSTKANKTIQVKDSGALAGLKGLQCIDGSVRVNVKGSLADLGALQIVIGDLVIEGGDAGALDKLERVDGLFTLKGADMTRLALPALKLVGSFKVKNNPRLTEISLPSLLSVSEDISIVSNVSLTSIAAPKVRNVKNLTLAEFGNFTRTQGFEKLGIVLGDLTLADLPSLTQIHFPELKTVKGVFLVEKASGLRQLDGLTKLGKAKSISIKGNAALKSLVVPPQLKALAVLEIKNNGKLDAAAVEAFSKAIEKRAAGVQIQASGNGAGPAIACAKGKGDAVEGMVVAQEKDLERLAAATCVVGDLHFLGHALSGKAKLKKLKSVSGKIVVHQTDLASLQLARVTTAGGLHIAGNTALTKLGLGALKNVEGAVVIDLVLPVKGFKLSRLKTVGGKVHFAGMGFKKIPGLAKLAQAKSLTVTGTAAKKIGRLADKVKTWDSIDISHNADLALIKAASKATAIEKLRFVDNPKLKKIAGFSKVKSLSQTTVTGNGSLKKAPKKLIKAAREGKVDSDSEIFEP